MGSNATTVAVVPIRSFRDSKHRLSSVLDDRQREQLSRWTAERVVDALIGRPTLIVSDDPGVTAWASDRNCDTLDPRAPGLINAVNAARDELRLQGAGRMAVIHADLPLPGALHSVLETDGIVVVPDNRGDGTNVFVIPTTDNIALSYGRGSFRRHLQACALSAPSVPLTVLRHPTLGIDIDTEDDLRHPLIAPLIKEVII